MHAYTIRLAAGAIAIACAAPAVAQLPPPVLVSPNGVVDGTSNTFSWRARPGATWYQLWISDSVQSPRLAEWYTAAQAGCADGTGMCSVNVAIDLAEGHVAWWVRSYNAAGNGPWSPQTNVFLRRTPGAWSSNIPAAMRFQLVLNGQAVLDRETGLVWQRTPGVTQMGLTLAHAACLQSNAGGKSGWRIPSAAELSTLGGPTGTAAPPDGHPFVVGTDPRFWTNTIYGLTSNYVAVSFTAGGIGLSQSLPTATDQRVWCVRSAAAGDPR